MMMNAMSKRFASMTLPQTRLMRMQTGSYLTATTAFPSRASSFLIEALEQQKEKQKQKIQLPQPLQLAQTRSFFSSPIREARNMTPKPEQFVAPDTIMTDRFGRSYRVEDLMKTMPRKIKPGKIRSRINKMHTYEGREKNIRHSPWRLQLICKMVSGLTLEMALVQLQFLEKRFAPLVHKVLKRTSNLADIRHSIQISQLEVAECFATQGSHLKRVKPMGRGRQGIMHHKFSHMRVVLREIDFTLKIFTARTTKQKMKWILHQQRAQAQHEKALAMRAELEALERQSALKQIENKQIG